MNRFVLGNQRHQLPFCGVLVQCLDEKRQPIEGAFASGFIRKDAGRLWLYTAWHVVTGIDPFDVKVPREPPNRRFLKIALQLTQKPQPGVEVIGGLQTLTLALYDPGKPKEPLWHQDRQHVPQPDLNSIGLFVPFWHDVVRVELPHDLQVSELQVIDEKKLNFNLLVPGDKCLIVGYPYGFSVQGPDQPTPIALTRFIASNYHNQRHLLESIGAPGMSGGPVFVEHDSVLLLAGVYTGLVYPDYSKQSNEKVTALGTICDLMMHFGEHGLKLVARPEEAVERRR